MILPDKKIVKQVAVNASPEELWAAWTTVEGVKTFFAPEAEIEMKLEGKYELYFMLDAPEGSRGSEEVIILSYIPNEMLSFTWNAPPNFGELRFQHTWVVVQFTPEAENKTSVKLTHLGWREGDDWQEVYDYFVRAWDIVLGRLKQRFDEGPIDWSKL